MFLMRKPNQFHKHKKNINKKKKSWKDEVKIIIICFMRFDYYFIFYWS